MKMKGRIILLIVVVLVIFVSFSCLMSEISWMTKENSPESLRQLVGLPSVATGNLSPAARNPGLEMFCTGLYDVPGGYCSYFTPGVPFIDFRPIGNITVSDSE